MDGGNNNLKSSAGNLQNIRACEGSLSSERKIFYFNFIL